MAKLAGSTPGAVKYVDANALAFDTVTLSNTGSTNAVAITDTYTIAFTNLVLRGNFTVNAPTIVAYDTTKLGDAASGTGTLNNTGGLISVSDVSSTLSIGTTGSIVFTATRAFGAPSSPLQLTQTPVNVQTVNPIALMFASLAQPAGLIFAPGSSVSAFLGGPGFAVTLAANASQLMANATVSNVQGTAAAAVASKAGFDTDSVVQQINYGFAGNVGVSPPMNHIIDETGVSVPEGFGQVDDDETSPR